MQEYTHVQTDEQQEQDNPTQLMLWMEHFARQYKFASSRKMRQEELMRRKKAKTWSPQKTAKMVRRLVAANKEIEQASNALTNVASKLEKLGIKIDVVPRSPLVEP